MVRGATEGAPPIAPPRSLRARLDPDDQTLLVLRVDQELGRHRPLLRRQQLDTDDPVAFVEREQVAIDPVRLPVPTFCFDARHAAGVGSPRWRARIDSPGMEETPQVPARRRAVRRPRPAGAR